MIREKLRKVIVGKCEAEGLDIFTDDWYKIARIIRKQKLLN